MGGQNAFALDVPLIRALQTITDSGPQEVLQRLTTGRWRADDILHTIRLGLVGGGMSETDAARLVDSQARLNTLGSLLPTAHSILLIAILGDPDETPPATETETAG